MKHAKLILEAAKKYAKASDDSQPVDQAEALRVFNESLNQFVLDVLKEQKRQRNNHAALPYR